ncbi:MAG: ribbon-helix-helix protein, CopG family [Terracidiphilus sp.]|nr:ribbon-helix-helix protein, CopG family [Terracidiphilus sp.]
MTDQNTAQVRATISFPPDVYQTLEAIAKQKKVSLAWVVRDAAEHYITSRKNSRNSKGRQMQGVISHDY